MKREVKVVPYQLEWESQFHDIKKTLHLVFAHHIIDVKHFGSTSVKDMWAKPTIDVMVIIDEISHIDIYNDQMIKIGYVPKGEHGISQRRYFVKYDRDGVTHLEHIHCYQFNNRHIEDELMFCDYLKVDPIAFENYKKVKIEAAQLYPYDPISYQAYKLECMTDIINKAKSYYKKI